MNIPITLTPVLVQIEQLRLELVKRILDLTGLEADEVQVEVSLSPERSNALIAEAKAAGWHRDSHQESNWYTTEQPSNGATIIFDDTKEKS